MEFDAIYEPPALVELGDHEELTMGGSMGISFDGTHARWEYL
ncbi:hypothetical protein Lesp02_34700 [Lentzea sp. NBRC 105346]|nr:lasso RiPP family leader peptide-containing protein [Lentzea sp. NBRC 105346]GLZ31282.1 hypothetical protein Lesp02_34700 [Lentzea sp. NBRC 105346]